MDTKIFCWGRNGGCEKYADFLTKELNSEIRFFPSIDITNSTLAVFVVPVHAQSIPKSAITCVKKIKAVTGYAFPVVVCGNISFGNSLYKLGKLLKNSGFKILGGAKMLSAHSYNVCGLKIAENRPDKNDLSTLLSAIKKAAESVNNNDISLKKFKSRQNIFSKLPRRFLAKFSVKIPIKNSGCINCLKCILVCPENAIKENLCIDKKLCIRCLKCATICPVNARQAKFSQPFIKRYLNSHKKDIKSVVFLND